MPYGKGTYGNKVGRPPKKTQKPVMEMQKKATETKAATPVSTPTKRMQKATTKKQAVKKGKSKRVQRMR